MKVCLQLVHNWGMIFCEIFTIRNGIYNTIIIPKLFKIFDKRFWAHI